MSERSLNRVSCMKQGESGDSSAMRWNAPTGTHGLWALVCLACAVYVASPLAGTQASPVLDAYTGLYELAPSFHLTVTREGSVLYLRPTGQRRAPLTPRGGHEFVIIGSNLRVIFGVRRDTGEVVDLLFEQGGLGRRATKLAESARPDRPPTVQVPSEVLIRYVGTYEEQPGFAITITYDGIRLKAQLTDMPVAVIVPFSRTEFFSKDTNARITFRVDREGVVSALVLHQGDSDLELIRVDSR